MASVRYTARALEDLERLADFLAIENPAAASLTVDLIEQALTILEAHPLMGRPAANGRRELIISRGRSGYIALYRYLPNLDRANILAIWHQREAGFEDD